MPILNTALLQHVRVYCFELLTTVINRIIITNLKIDVLYKYVYYNNIKF